MRLRDDTLRTGKLLAWFDAGDRRRNAGLLFLVRGYEDVVPLTRIEGACRSAIDERASTGFEWHEVADRGQLSVVDPLLDPEGLTSIEVAEFADLDPPALASVLGPAVEILTVGAREVFPRAGGALGGRAEGIQFLDREEELAAAIRYLEDGANLEVQAPRRSGKTSLLRQLALRMEASGSAQRVYLLDLERELSPEDLAARFHVLASGGSYRAAQEKATSGWERLLTDALEKLGQADAPVVLLLDELVHFFLNLTGSEAERRRQAKGVLEILAEQATGKSLRWVLANSLPIREYLEEALGMHAGSLPAAFRDAVVVRLAPLAMEPPYLDLRRLLLGTGLVAGPAEVAWLAEEVGLALPYQGLRFLDALASALRGRPDLDRPGMEALLDQFLAGTDAFADFDLYLARKNQRTPGALPVLRRALDRLGILGREETVPRAELEAVLGASPGRPGALYAWLVETFPISEEDGGGLRFASPLFRRWWRRQLEEGGAA